MASVIQGSLLVAAHGFVRDLQQPAVVSQTRDEGGVYEPFFRVLLASGIVLRVAVTVESEPGVCVKCGGAIDDDAVVTAKARLEAKLRADAVPTPPKVCSRCLVAVLGASATAEPDKLRAAARAVWNDAQPTIEPSVHRVRVELLRALDSALSAPTPDLRALAELANEAADEALFDIVDGHEDAWCLRRETLNKLIEALELAGVRKKSSTRAEDRR